MVRSENTNAKYECKTTLRDSLPKFIDELASAIKQQEMSGHARSNLLRVAYEHAEDRAEETQCTVEEVIREYEILRKVIFEVLEKDNLLHKTARETILEAVATGMAEASVQINEWNSKRVRRIQNQLNESEDLFKAVFDHAASGKALIDVNNGRYIKVNRKFCEIHGYTEEELSRMTINDITFEADREKQSNLFKTKIAAKSNGWKLEKRNVAKDGRIIWVLASSAILYSEDGNPSKIVTTVVDISEMKKAEEELRESEVRFRGFAEAMPQMAFIADAKGNIIYFNERHYDYFGVKRGETEGEKWKSTPMHHPDDLQRTIDSWKESVETGKPYEIEYRLRRHDGTYRWHLGRAVAQKDENGNIIRWIGTNTDIEDHKEHALQQKKLIESLNSEKDLREKFVGTLTHDLRTPLSVIKMSAQILESEVTEPDASDMIKRILRNVTLCDQMIRDLLDTNRIRGGRGISIKANHCVMPEAVKVTLRNLEVVYGPRFQLEYDNTCDGYWDPDGIRRITENLVTNAIKYGDAKAPVTVRVKDSGETVHLIVNNKGPVISEEEQKKLFDQFSRLKSAESGGQKGWGIGLTIVKGIAEAHCANIHVTSNVMDGTTFTVSFPRDARPCVSDRINNQEMAR
ncbi:MAG: hypothetical protein K0R29_805 [Pseudobdellovibrio sp.]|nr:hypothetical protein [Pseudobdellovibrio sp.]